MCTRDFIPSSFDSLAMRSAPLYCTAENVLFLSSIRIPTQLTAASAPYNTSATDASSRMLQKTGST